MKKYFLKETGEQVKIGDIVVLNLEGTNKKRGKINAHLEVKATPLMLSLLIDEGIIEERDLEEEVKGIKFNVEELKKHTTESKINARLDELDERLTELEGIVAEWNNE